MSTGIDSPSYDENIENLITGKEGTDSKYMFHDEPPEIETKSILYDYLSFNDNTPISIDSVDINFARGSIFGINCHIVRPPVI